MGVVSCLAMTFSKAHCRLQNAEGQNLRCIDKYVVFNSYFSRHDYFSLLMKALFVEASLIFSLGQSLCSYLQNHESGFISPTLGLKTLCLRINIKFNCCRFGIVSLELEYGNA